MTLGSLIAPFWGRKEIIWTQSSGVCLAPRRYSWYYTCWLMQKSLWLSPKAGSGRDRMPLTAEGVQAVFIGWAQKQARTKPNSLHLPQWSRWRVSSHPCRTYPMLLLPHPALYCSHQPRPCSPVGCVHLCWCISVTGKDSCHCPWLQFKHIQCHCKFYGTIFIEDLVTRQLLYNL